MPFLKRKEIDLNNAIYVHGLTGKSILSVNNCVLSYFKMPLDQQTPPAKAVAESTPASETTAAAWSWNTAALRHTGSTT